MRKRVYGGTLALAPPVVGAGEGVLLIEAGYDAQNPTYRGGGAIAGDALTAFTRVKWAAENLASAPDVWNIPNQATNDTYKLARYVKPGVYNLTSAFFATGCGTFALPMQTIWASIQAQLRTDWGDGSSSVQVGALSNLTVQRTNYLKLWWQNTTEAPYYQKDVNPLDEDIHPAGIALMGLIAEANRGASSAWATMADQIWAYLHDNWLPKWRSRLPSNWNAAQGIADIGSSVPWVKKQDENTLGAYLAHTLFMARMATLRGHSDATMYQAAHDTVMTAAYDIATYPHDSSHSGGLYRWSTPDGEGRMWATHLYTSPTSRAGQCVYASEFLSDLAIMYPLTPHIIDATDIARYSRTLRHGFFKVSAASITSADSVTSQGYSYASIAQDTTITTIEGPQFVADVNYRGPMDNGKYSYHACLLADAYTGLSQAHIQAMYAARHGSSMEPYSLGLTAPVLYRAWRAQA